MNNFCVVVTSETTFDVVHPDSIEKSHRNMPIMTCAEDLRLLFSSPISMDQITATILGAEIEKSETVEQASIRLWQAFATCLSEEEEETNDEELPEIKEKSPDVIEVHDDYDWLTLELYMDKNFGTLVHNPHKRLLLCLLHNEVKVQTFDSLVRRASPYFDGMYEAAIFSTYILKLCETLKSKGILNFHSFMDMKQGGLVITPYVEHDSVIPNRALFRDKK